MPDAVEPTQDGTRPEPSDRRAEAGLTTASLARARGDHTRSFANDGADTAERPEPLFRDDETTRLRQEWDSIQASFVDEPRQAVEAADHLVASAIKRMAESFAEEKARLEGQWDRGGDVSTEDLRQALRRYRSFFGRVLSI